MLSLQKNNPLLMTKSVKKAGAFQWKSVLAIVILTMATIYNYMPVWGVLFLFWAWMNIKSKETFLVERVQRSESPVLYWAIVTGWIVLGILTFFPEYQ